MKNEIVLFDRDKSVISKHIKNAFEEELDNSTVAKFTTVQKEGTRKVTRNKVINNYSNALNLLDDYDHKRITKPSGTTTNNKIVYEDCMNIINNVKIFLAI